jgi:hypothetical protein
MTFTMPTEEEWGATSTEWMKPLRPCLYTYWPARFKELSFRTHVVDMTPEEVKELCDTFDHVSLKHRSSVHQKITEGASQYDSGCFFKLESRSPKDNYWGEMTNFRACSFHDVMKLLYSERILDDLTRYRYSDEPLRLLFREWHPINKSGEFRCFIKNRKLAGTSQYHYCCFDDAFHKPRPAAYADIFARKSELAILIQQFITDEIIANLHIDDLVVDLWIDHMRKVTLIEINPYGLSDPCLLNYEELETSTGLFRVVDAETA